MLSLPQRLGPDETSRGSTGWPHPGPRRWRLCQCRPSGVERHQLLPWRRSCGGACADYQVGQYEWPEECGAAAWICLRRNECVRMGFTYSRYMAKFHFPFQDWVLNLLGFGDRRPSMQPSRRDQVFLRCPLRLATIFGVISDRPTWMWVAISSRPLMILTIFVAKRFPRPYRCQPKQTYKFLPPARYRVPQLYRNCVRLYGHWGDCEGCLQTS